MEIDRERLIHFTKLKILHGRRKGDMRVLLLSKVMLEKVRARDLLLAVYKKMIERTNE